MAVPQIQSSFNAGEISPELYGEVDLARLSSAATTARNMFVAYRGGLQSRGGLAFVGRSKQRGLQPPPRLIPFQFSITQGTILEWGEQYLRFIFDGAYVVEDPVAITGATKANPAVISVSGTPFAANDDIFITGVVGMTQLNGNTYQVRSPAAGSFQLYDLDGNPIDSTGYTTYISGGVAARIYTVDSPYAAEDLPYLKFSQSADVMSLACSNPDTGTEYPPYELKRFGPINWTLTPVNISVPILPPDTVTAAAQAQAPASGINATFGYVVTAIDKDGNESIASLKAECHGADIEVEGGTNIVSYTASAGAIQYNIYRSPAVVDTSGGPTSIPDGAFYGFVGSSFGTQYSDTVATADLSQTPPLHENPLAPGQITAVNIVTGGSGLTNLSYTINTTTGSNFYGYPLLNGGALAAFVIIDPGQDYANTDTITFSSGTFASGFIAYNFVFQPSNGDTVTLNGVVFTYVTGTPTGNQIKIQGTLQGTIATLASAASASLDPLLTVASYVVDSSGVRLVITYKTIGTGGNSYTLAASTFGAHVSGGTLTGGGTTSGTVPTATLTISPQTGTWPGVVTYFQQRRFFANSFNNPDTFWASQTGLFNNFDTRIPTQPNDAITASPWTEQVNGIQWLIPMPGGLIAMTGKRAWQILGEGTYQFNVQPITPASVQAQPQAFNGSSPTIPPFVENYDVLYVQAIGNSTVRDLSWNLITNIYTGTDLTILSSHLFQNYRLTQWAWAREPYKVLWSVRDDGTLLSFTYLKEQEVFGWARHDTLGLVVSVATITEPPVDAIYAVVKRFPPNPGQVNGIYTVERMDNRLWQTVEDTYAVDAGISNPMRLPDTPVQANQGTGNSLIITDDDTFTAGDVGNIVRMAGGIGTIVTYVNTTHVRVQWVLDASNGAPGFPYATPGEWSIATPVTSLRGQHLAGYGVVGLADGVPIGPITADALGTVTLPFAASDVKVGLPFTAQMQTPYINGGQPTIQGRRKVIPACTVRIASSGGFQIGTNQPDGAAQNPIVLAPAWSNLSTSTEAQQGAKTYKNPANQTVTQLWTGDVRQTLQGDWKKPGQVAIQQTLPLPLEVIAVVPEILPGDSPENTYSPKQDGDTGSSPRGPGKHMLRL